MPLCPAEAAVDYNVSPICGVYEMCGLPRWDVFGFTAYNPNNFDRVEL